jgi:hypothetical protein
MSKTPFEIYTGDLTDEALEEVMDWYGVRDADELPKPLALLVQGDDWVEEPSPAPKAEKNSSIFYAKPTQVKFLCPTLNWQGYIYHNGIAYEDHIIDLVNGTAYSADEIFAKFPDVPHDKLIGAIYTHWKEIPEI